MADPIPQKTAPEIVEGNNGLTVEVDVTHTRYFTPEHRDGAPFGVCVECDGWNYGRDGVTAALHFTPDKADAFALALIRAAARARSKLDDTQVQWVLGEECATLKGMFCAAELRAIADHMDAVASVPRLVGAPSHE